MAEKPTITAFWHELYIEMLSNPNEYQSDKGFCEETKIPTSTFHVWKSKNRRGIFDEVQKRRQLYINELRSNAWKELANKMKKDVNAIKLAFQLTGDLVERTENKHEYMTRQDKIDRMNALLKDINDKKETWKKVKEAQSGASGVTADTGVGNVSLGDVARKGMPSDGAV